MARARRYSGEKGANSGPDQPSAPRTESGGSRGGAPRSSRRAGAVGGPWRCLVRPSLSPGRGRARRRVVVARDRGRWRTGHGLGDLFVTFAGTAGHTEHTDQSESNRRAWTHLRRGMLRDFDRGVLIFNARLRAGRTHHTAVTPCYATATVPPMRANVVRASRSEADPVGSSDADARMRREAHTTLEGGRVAQTSRERWG